MGLRLCWAKPLNTKPGSAVSRFWFRAYGAVAQGCTRLVQQVRMLYSSLLLGLYGVALKPFSVS